MSQLGTGLTSTGAPLISSTISLLLNASGFPFGCRVGRSGRQLAVVMAGPACESKLHGNFVSRSPLCLSSAQADAGICRNRGADVGDRHRRQHGHFQPGERGPVQPERVITAYVSGNFFDALGVHPAVGRLFLRSEGEVLDSDPVVVLDYDFWKARFNGDPNVIGREVTVNGHPLSVIGVAPKGFRGLPSIAVTLAAYLPLSQLTLEGTPADVLNRWQTRSVLLYGRLRPGFSLKQADAELNVAAQNLMREQPDDEKAARVGSLSRAKCPHRYQPERDRPDIRVISWPGRNGATAGLRERG